MKLLPAQRKLFLPKRIARLHTILNLLYVIFVKSQNLKNKKFACRTLLLQKVSSNRLKFEFYKEIS